MEEGGSTRRGQEARRSFSVQIQMGAGSINYTYELCHVPCQASAQVKSSTKPKKAPKPPNKNKCRLSSHSTSRSMYLNSGCLLRISCSRRSTSSASVSSSMRLYRCSSRRRAGSSADNPPPAMPS